MLGQLAVARVGLGLQFPGLAGLPSRLHLVVDHPEGRGDAVRLAVCVEKSIGVQRDPVRGAVRGQHPRPGDQWA